MAGRLLHSALSHGTFRTTGGLTAGKQISSVTIHHGGVTLTDSIVTAATVNPLCILRIYTKEGVELLCILPYTSVNVCVFNGQRLKFNPVNGQSPKNQRCQRSKC